MAAKIEPAESYHIHISRNPRQQIIDEVVFCEFTMESFLKNLKEHVSCSICLDIYTEPKTIACLHTFCCECLKKHVLTSQRDGQFRCPECQAQITIPECVDDLPTGFLQNSLLSLLAVRQSGDGSEINCGSCKQKSAESSFCFDCGRFLCPVCVNAHELLRNIAFDGHRVTSVKQFQAEDYEALLKRKSFCSQQYHEREVTKFYCLECQSCVCQICIATDHKNHTVDPLDKAADIEKAKVMAGVELMTERSKVCIDLIHEFEQTAVNLETNITAAKCEVSQTAEQMITRIREREREVVTDLENTHVSRIEKLNSVKAQVQSLAKQINQAVEFAKSLVQRSSSSDIMQSHKSLEQRFEDLNKTPLPALPVSSFVKFFSTCKPDNLTLGYKATIETVVEGLAQDFQAGVEAELIICPKLTNEAQGKCQIEIVVEPAEDVESILTLEKEDGNFQVTFTPIVPGTYTINVNIDGEKLAIAPIAVHVMARQLDVVGELVLKAISIPQQPCGIAVNSKGVIAVADPKSHYILIYDNEGKYLRKIGSYGNNAGQLYSPTGVTYLNDDHILVADELNHCIQEFNVDTGKFVRRFGKYGMEEGEFKKPVNVCIDGEGQVVVSDCANNRMQVFTKNGEPVFGFGDDGSRKLNRPTGCVFYKNMLILSDTWNHCLKMFDKSGTFFLQVGEQGKGDGQLSYPWGLCVNNWDNRPSILVCDRGNGRIVQYTMQGSFTGKTVKKLTEPIAIATTPDGQILVSDFQAKKIYVLK